MEGVNSEIEDFANSIIFLDSIFHLNRNEIILINNSTSVKIERSIRENIMLKFMARLNDEDRLETK